MNQKYFALILAVTSVTSLSAVAEPAVAIQGVQARHQSISGLRAEDRFEFSLSDIVTPNYWTFSDDYSYQIYLEINHSSLQKPMSFLMETSKVVDTRDLKKNAEGNLVLPEVGSPIADAFHISIFGREINDKLGKYPTIPADAKISLKLVLFKENKFGRDAITMHSLDIGSQSKGPGSAEFVAPNPLAGQSPVMNDGILLNPAPIKSNGVVKLQMVLAAMSPAVDQAKIDLQFMPADSPENYAASAADAAKLATQIASLGNRQAKTEGDVANLNQNVGTLTQAQNSMSNRVATLQAQATAEQTRLNGEIARIDGEKKTLQSQVEAQAAQMAADEAAFLETKKEFERQIVTLNDNIARAETKGEATATAVQPLIEARQELERQWKVIADARERELRMNPHGAVHMSPAAQKLKGKKPTEPKGTQK